MKHIIFLKICAKLLKSNHFSEARRVIDAYIYLKNALIIHEQNSKEIHF